MAYNDYLINTDSPQDKIIYMNSGSFAITSGSFSVINVPHGLPFRPLTVTTWSTEPTFSVSYEAGASGYTDNTRPQLTAQSTSSNLRFVPTNLTGSTVTFYWRTFAFMPSDIDIDSAFTSVLADSFVFNTAYNYAKLLIDGIILWSSGTHAVNHNLGYRPQVDIWYEEELDSDVLTRWHLGSNTNYMATDNVRVTNTQLLFDFRSSGGVAGRKWYYRIYADTGVAP